MQAATQRGVGSRQQAPKQCLRRHNGAHARRLQRRCNGSQFPALREEPSHSTVIARAGCYSFSDSPHSKAIIKVLGVGGGGSNVVNRMMDDNIQGIEAWVFNTDAQALATSRVPEQNRVQIGAKATRGLGAGGNPQMGLEAAKESKDEIEAALQGADMVFVTAGLGGGTGSGAAPLVCEIAQNMNILTVAVATLPFSFEGRRRMTQANIARQAIKECCDTMIIVENDKLLDSAFAPANLPVEEAFKFADQALIQGVRGITDIIMVPGLVNVDFADVKEVMMHAGNSHMAHGLATGKTRAEDAAMAAIGSPLLDTEICSARGVVWNITGPPDLTLSEINQAASIIYNVVHRDDANIIFGAVIDPEFKDEVLITLIATGFDKTDAMTADGMQAGAAPAAAASPSPMASQGSVPKIPTFLKNRRR